MEDEIWKDIPGYEGYYQVSNLGRVRSLDRCVKCVNKFGSTYYRRLRGRIVDQDDKGLKYGHLKVKLWADNKQEKFLVHRLVALAFLGQGPRGCDVRHLDGNPKNNSVKNLAYGTRSENILDSYGYRGRLRSNTTDKDTALAIKKLLTTTDMTHKEIAEKVGSGKSTVDKISSGVTFKWLEA